MKGWPSTSTFTWIHRKATFRRMNLSTYCRRKWRHQIRRKERKRKQLQFSEILASICKVLISKVNSYFLTKYFCVFDQLIVAPYTVCCLNFLMWSHLRDTFSDHFLCSIFLITNVHQGTASLMVMAKSSWCRHFFQWRLVSSSSSSIIIDLQASTLVGLTWENPELYPLALLHLNN